MADNEIAKKIDKKHIITALIFVLGEALTLGGLAGFYDQYLAWSNMVLLAVFFVIQLAGICALAYLTVNISEKAEKSKTITACVITPLVWSVLLWGLTYLINVVIGKEQLNVLAIEIASAVLIVFTAVISIIAVMKSSLKKLFRIIISIVLALVFAAGSVLVFYADIRGALYSDYKAAVPMITSELPKGNGDVVLGDYYVSPKGDDKKNDGTLEKPFATIEKAIEVVNKLDKKDKESVTICIKTGEYRIDPLVFTEEFTGTDGCEIIFTAFGNGEVILNCATQLNPADFDSSDEYPFIEERLTDSARDRVRILDLTKKPYELTEDDWGKLYAMGSYNTANKYDGDYVGPLGCELFVNDTRQTIARYPNEGFLHTGKVVITGEGLESDGATTRNGSWDDARNPQSDVYEIDSKLSARIASWHELSEVWMMGYWKYDWADASSPVGAFDPDNSTISPKFVSLYGTKEGAPYYFYNVLEELDTEGEWYINRKNGLLCLYAPANFAEASIDLALTLEPVIKINADNMTFRNLTITGTRGTGIVVEGNNNTIDGCLVKNVSDYAINVTGTGNKVINCEITHTGKGGIILNGGDRDTLTAGNNIADNNLIHDWSEIYFTYCPAVTLNGVGNTCSHNEIYNSPHEAITWSGNNHVIEYNLIHDVCLLSDDAGAIYSGRRWDWYGTVIRYNAIYNLGSEGHTPDGIYLDDALSGHEVYGNILVNIPKLGLHLGGGRDLSVWGNIIINAGEHPISYDQRARDGAVSGGWFDHAAQQGDMWQLLYESPYLSGVWQNAYPQYMTFSDNFADTESPDFVPNPANSTVKDNLIFDKNSSIGNISEAAERFSDISGNAVYSLNKLEKIFADSENGDYTVKDLEALRKEIPGFENIPLEDIGRR